ncbi:MAG TPA: hypothetical protein VH370_14660 [Humisphaera sp.]|nr:hypothetical protein [Humisphaera sp.]
MSSRPTFALRHDVALISTDPATNATLIQSVMDLKLVQSVVEAMRAADIASGRPQPVSKLGPAPTPPPDRLERDPVFAMRPVYHPEPRYERQVVIHPEPRVEFCAPIVVKPCEPQCECEYLPVASKPEMESPLAPPWRMPVWNMPIVPPPKIKVVQYRPDIINKGSLLDFFV